MIKRIICFFTRSWNLFSTIPAYLPTCLTGHVQSTSKEKLYQELSLESLQLQCWYKKLGIFYKIYKSKDPQYLFKSIPEKTSSYVTRNAGNIPLFNFRHNFYKNSFFPSTINEWNSLDTSLQNSENFGIFKNNIFKFIRPKSNSILTAAILRGLSGSHDSN